MAGSERWVRIPLIGDVEGIVLLLPAEPLSEANWHQFTRCLEAMRPGLTVPPATVVAATHDSPQPEGNDSGEVL